jgi:predicted KAP-like P-loop ATPase
MKDRGTLQEKNLFSSDSPILSEKEDVLGRKNFSQALAQAIRNWTGQESLVIALYGPWGNGKTSAKNMVLDFLYRGSPSIHTTDFNPWQLANKPSLSEAFFDELGVALGKGDLGSNTLKKSTLARYRRWAHSLKGGSDLAHLVRNAFGSILIILGALTIGSAKIGSETAALVLGGLLIFGGILAFISRLIDSLIKLLEAGIDVGSKSIGEIKDELISDLRKRKTPLLVAIDDLDRLTPQELLEIFQLIKANANFPNVTYLILGDRAVLEANVTRALGVSGRDYLEKIVQVAFDLPIVDIGIVREVLSKRLESLLSGAAIAAHFYEKRWANIFWSSLHVYFQNLRDVNRFTSALAFQIASFSADGAFEVNPIDLIGLEVIRQFEPDAYKAIRASKDLLTASKRPDKPMAEVAAKSATAIVEASSENHRDEFRELLRHLFPTIDWALGGSNYASEYGDRWYRDMRVCSSKVFDRYFRLAVSEHELSQAAAQKLLLARTDRIALREELEALNSRGLLNLGFEELGVYQDEVAEQSAKPYITAIFDVADELSDEKRTMFETPAAWRIGFLVRKAVERLSSSEARANILVDAIRETKGLFMAVEFVALIEVEPDKEDKEPSLLPNAEMELLKGVAVKKIQNAAASGELEQNTRLASLMGLWRKWGKADDVAKYADAITQTHGGTQRLLRSLVVRSMGHESGDYVGTERYYIRRNNIEAIFSMDILNARVKALPPEALNDEDRRAIRAFEKAMERRAAGKPDDDPFARD